MESLLYKGSVSITFSDYVTSKIHGKDMLTLYIGQHTDEFCIGGKIRLTVRSWPNITQLSSTGLVTSTFDSTSGTGRDPRTSATSDSTDSETKPNDK